MPQRFITDFNVNTQQQQFQSDGLNYWWNKPQTFHVTIYLMNKQIKNTNITFTLHYTIKYFT